MKTHERFKEVKTAGIQDGLILEGIMAGVSDEEMKTRIIRAIEVREFQIGYLEEWLRNLGEEVIHDQDEVSGD